MGGRGGPDARRPARGAALPDARWYTPGGAPFLHPGPRAAPGPGTSRASGAPGASGRLLPGSHSPGSYSPVSSSPEAQITSSSSIPASTSRGFVPSGGPRIPASWSWSTIRAARP